MKENLIYSVIPIHGIEIDKPFLMESNGRILWGITPPNDHTIYKELVSNMDSLTGNLEMIKSKQHPHAFLFALNPIALSQPSNDDRAEVVLSALFLAINAQRRVGDGSSSFVPVYRKRFIDLADYFLAFNSSGTKIAGHTSRIGLLSWDPIKLDHYSLENKLTLLPTPLRTVLQGKHTPKAVTDLLLILARVFDNISTGAFITSLLTVIEELISDNDSWEHLRAKLKFLFPSHEVFIERLSGERNDYVHRGKLPINDEMTIKGMDFLIHIIIRAARFNEAYPSLSFKRFISHQYRLKDAGEFAAVNFQF